jgi:hypothetical protein
MRPETPEQFARRVLRELREVLRRSGRNYLRYKDTIDGLRLTIGAKQVEETVDPSLDLPDALQIARPSTRQVYRALRGLRAMDATAAIWPGDLAKHLERICPSTIPSLDTINHALRDLRDRSLAWSHPDRGWILGTHQPRLPFSAGQSDAPSASETRGYVERVADTSVCQFNREASVIKTRIWVPGEKSEYGVVVTDPITEKAVAVSERIGEMKVPTRRGKLASSPAVRAELLAVDGKHVVVKLPGGEKIHTRVLGDWQLKGFTSPDQAAVEVSTPGAA